MESDLEPELPDGLLEDVFNRLPGTDLKACRLVCKRWNGIIINWTFQHKTCFEFNGKTKLHRKSWKHHITPKSISNAKLARTLTKYLIPQTINEGSETTNTSLARPWSSLRFRKVSNHQLNCLMSTWTEYNKNAEKKKPALTAVGSEVSVFRNSNPFQKHGSAVQHVLGSVTKLELTNCTIQLSTLLNFLSCFKNLRKFIDDHSIYPYWSWRMICSDIELVNSMLAPPLERHINQLCKTRSFPSIKSVVIKRPGAYSNTLQVLLLLELTLSDLEEFSLYLNEEDRYPLFSLDYPERLGLFLLRHAKTLLKIEFNWWHTYYELYFEDCLRTLQIFATTQAPLLLTELILNVQWIFILREDFQRVFIPIIHRLQFLKKLFLAKIMFEPTTRTIHVLHELIGQSDDAAPHPQLHSTITTSPKRLRCPVDLDFTFGLFVCDPMNEDRIMNTAYNIFDPRRILMNHQLLRTTRELLKSPIIKTGMISLHLAFDLSFINCVEQLLPLQPTPEVYDKVKELNITSTRSATYSKQFSDYHIDILVKSFPNLVKLGIFDGPQFLYADKIPRELENQYDNMSNAMIGNGQFQTILKALTRLKSLRLRVNFQTVTDAGLTGIKEEVCQELSQGVKCQSRNIGQDDRNGVALSNLPALEEVMLKGLPSTVTNVTAFNAFNGCRNVRQIVLCGQFQFTKQGEDYLRTIGCKNNFKLQLNTP